MKKYILGLACGIMLSAATAVYASDAIKAVRQVFINDHLLNSDVQVTENGMTMISARALAEALDEKIVNAEEQVIIINQGACLEDAKFLEKLILEKHKVKEIMISNIGPTVGSHTGPGVLALFFLGERR
jgi:hypothetical protein